MIGTRDCLQIVSGTLQILRKVLAICFGRSEEFGQWMDDSDGQLWYVTDECSPAAWQA